MSGSPTRRRFQRIPFDAKTELHQGQGSWPATLLDLSLKGLLVERPMSWDADLAQPLEATVHLDPHTQVRLHVELRHEEDNRLGFSWTTTDLESLSHLHRLMQLNLADEAEIQRELRELIDI